jgi:hypothetical protein
MVSTLIHLVISLLIRVHRSIAKLVFLPLLLDHQVKIFSLYDYFIFI